MTKGHGIKHSGTPLGNRSKQCHTYSVWFHSYLAGADCEILNDCEGLLVNTPVGLRFMINDQARGLSVGEANNFVEWKQRRVPLWVVASLRGGGSRQLAEVPLQANEARVGFGELV